MKVGGRNEEEELDEAGGSEEVESFLCSAAAGFLTLLRYSDRFICDLLIGEYGELDLCYM